MVRRWISRGWGYLPLISPVLLLGVGAWMRAWIADDGLINVVVVDNVLNGNGPVFASGFRAETATSPLWLGLMCVVSLLPGVGVEQVAVWGGMGLTLVGALLGCLALRRADRGATLLPLGLLGYAAYPYSWDFASGGLENGAVCCWLGIVAFSGCAQDSGDRASIGEGFLLGLGALLRPDLALMSGVFLLSRGRLQRSRPWLDARVVCTAMAAPLAATVARAAYYSSLVPSAGLAKEGTSLRLDQGLRYVFLSLWPGGFVVIGILLLGLHLVHSGRLGVELRFVSASKPLALAGALHLVYVVMVGGDFMKGRMLLPGLFAFALAVGAVQIRRPSEFVIRAVAFAALIATLAAYSVPPLDRWVFDERDFYVGATGTAHPVNAEDYEHYAVPPEERALLAESPGTLVLWEYGVDTVIAPLSAEMRAKYRNVVITPALGGPGTSLGEDVLVLDPIGLADPIAAHQRLKVRARPGHEKFLSKEWNVARFSDPQAPIDSSLDAAEVAAARRALGCGKLATLIDNTTTELDLAQIWKNLRDAPALTRFRFDPDPEIAARELCDQ